jgi:CBS domain-containing protein
MNAADVMTRSVVTVAADAPIGAALRLMLQHHISGLPVVDSGGRLVGIVTEGDFLRRVEMGTEEHPSRWVEFLRGPGRGAGDYVRTHARKVGDVMTANVATASEETPLDHIVRFMELRHIKRVPVVTEGKLAGIVSRADLLRQLVDLVEPPAIGGDDATLRSRILAALEAQSWAPRAGIEISVHAGVVDLRGTILDPRERDALRVAAENVPGVKAVEDHLCWIEPTSGWVIDAPASERP